MQKSSFNCPCGYVEELSTHLVEISEHMSECHQFQQLSPLNRILNKYQMELLSYNKLLLLQADICSQISRISLYTNAKCISGSEVSLSEYGRFTNEESMEDRPRKQVKQNGDGLLKIQELIQENSSEDDFIIDECKINCSLCNQDFNSILMKCGHRLCQNCVILKYRDPTTYIRCPNCKVRVGPEVIMVAAEGGDQDTCLLCDKQFKSKGHLQRHLVNVHSQGKRFSCQQCTSTFNTYRLVLYHCSNKHMKDQQLESQ